MNIKSILTCLIFISVITRWTTEALTSSNSTQVDYNNKNVDDDDDDDKDDRENNNGANDNEDDDNDNIDDELNMNFEEFKRSVRRYRRLIPYMTFYVANNYVNNNKNNNDHDNVDEYDDDEAILPPPPPLPPSSPASILPDLAPTSPTLPLIRKAQKLIRPSLRRKPVNQQSTTLIKQDKFIPSVQYDPKNIGEDNDYFTPVRYNIKDNYDEYYGDYERRPLSSSTYPKITTSNIQENSYYAKEPLRSQTNLYNPLYEREHQLKQQQQHRQHHHHHHLHPSDYLIEGKSKTLSNQDDYPEFESLRFTTKLKPSPASPVYNQPANFIPPIQQQQHLKRPVVYNKKNVLLRNDNIVKSFQLTNQLPEILTKDNIDFSIKTLVEILSLLHESKKPVQLNETPMIPVQLLSPNLQHYNDFKPQYTTKPKVITETNFQVTLRPPLNEQSLYFKTQSDYPLNIKAPTSTSDDYTLSPYKEENGLKNVIEYYTPLVQDIDEDGNVETYPKQPSPSPPPQKIINPPQNLYSINENIKEDVAVTTEAPKHYQLSDNFAETELNVPRMAVKYGVTRGKPDIDYPIYSTVPETNFNCKKQRYKGFFGDPSTRCQVWHYCDLNGGKSSFLCPNGTIFSQVALTCDWWFNVKCESTTQLYVLNERLYKFILPIIPKFPEDFSGPEVDRYLELKFKEMEAKLKAKKLKKAMEKKMKEKTQYNEE